MPRRSATSAGKTCIGLGNVGKFLNFLYFYKANAVAVVAGGLSLQDLAVPENLDLFINNFNGYVEDLSKKVKGLETLSGEDFSDCSKELRSSELVEFKEYVKWSARPYKVKTSEKFVTLKGFEKVAKLADKIFKVRLGDKSYLMIIEVPPEYVNFRQVMSNVNKRFHAMAPKVADELGFTGLFVLANALLAEATPDCNLLVARMAVISGNSFTTMMLTPAPLCKMREFAKFYINLVDVKSSYAKPVASALLAYMQNYDEVERDVGPLYGIVRNTAHAMSRAKLSKEEREALERLVEAVSRR